jgi:Protein tyrosine and serine/threonine kinase
MGLAVTSGSTILHKPTGRNYGSAASLARLQWREGSYCACRSRGLRVTWSCILYQSMRTAALQVVYTYSQGLQWCAQIADGLAFLHAQSPRIIHRDVKLDNVLLTEGSCSVLLPELRSMQQVHTSGSIRHLRGTRRQHM